MEENKKSQINQIDHIPNSPQTEVVIRTQMYSSFSNETNKKSTLIGLFSVSLKPQFHDNEPTNIQDSMSCPA